MEEKKLPKFDYYLDESELRSANKGRGV